MSEIGGVWDRVEADSDLLILLPDAAHLNALRASLASAAVGGYDLFHLEAMASAGGTQILSDDGDFSTVAGIELFTANPRVLAAARAQGRLVVRRTPSLPRPSLDSCLDVAIALTDRSHPVIMACGWRLRSQSLPTARRAGVPAAVT